MKNIIKKIKPLYFILNKVRHFKIQNIFSNIGYAFALLTNKPYFGRKYGANMISKGEIKVLKTLLQLSPNGRALEIGSWAGASSVVIAKKLNLTCVDVWRGTDDEISITKSKISGNTIFNLFKRNIKFSGVEDYITPIQTTSDEFFKQNKDKFSFIYIDGDHRYAQIKKDIENAHECLEEGGVMCGHDLDGFITDEDLFRQNCEKDIAEIDGKIYHCGVSCAIKDVFNNKVGLIYSIWCIIKT